MLALEKARRRTGFRLGGLAGWLLERLRRKDAGEPHLMLVERIALAPRQSLALVEADGHRLLVAFSAEGAPVFHALGDAGPRYPRPEGSLQMRVAKRHRRISW